MDKIISIFYHECGHLIISQIFDKILNIEFITVDQTISKQSDALSEGGMKAKLSKNSSDLTVEDHDSLILVFLAGLCSDDLYEKDLKVSDSDFQMSTWGKKFATIKYSGDAELINRHFYFLNLHKKIDWESYISESIKLVSTILKDPIIRSVFELFLKKIIINSNHTLSKSEIEIIISESELPKWIENNKDSILKIRETLLHE